MRWAGSGRGKRSGARIIYYYANNKGRILLLDIYTKNEKENLSANDLKDLKEAVSVWIQQIEDFGVKK